MIDRAENFRKLLFLKAFMKIYTFQMINVWVSTAKKSIEIQIR